MLILDPLNLCQISMKKRVAILLCDEPAEHIKAEFGDYFKLFTNLLGEDFQYEGFDVTKQQYPNNPLDFDAYLLTGSKYSSYEDLAWIQRLKTFIREIDIIDNIRVLGVCFGHQIIAEALGGKCEKNNLGWEVGYEEIELTDVGKHVLCLSSSLNKSKLGIQEMHQDHVTVVPPGFDVLATTARSRNQMLLKPGKYWTVQGHPEYSAGFVQALIDMRLKKG